MVTNPVLYLLMRDDLPSMNPGKLAAQAAHVANAFAGIVPSKPIFIQNLYKAWTQQTVQFFGTTICLGASKEYLDSFTAKLPRENVIGDLVYDPTYPAKVDWELANAIKHVIPKSEHRIQLILDPETKTATLLRDEVVGAYVFAEQANIEVQTILAPLSLYP